MRQTVRPPVARGCDSYWDGVPRQAVMKRLATRSRESPRCYCRTRHADAPANVDVVRGLGADHVLDYRTQNITDGPARYDLVFQLGGTYSPTAVRKVLTPHGTLIQSFGDGGRWFGPIGHLLRAAALNPFVGQTLKSFTATETTATLDELRDLIEAGHLTPVITSTYPLAEAAQAVQLVEHGSPAGKVIVTVAPAPTQPTPN